MEEAFAFLGGLVAPLVALGQVVAVAAPANANDGDEHGGEGLMTLLLR